MVQQTTRTSMARAVLGEDNYRRAIRVLNERRQRPRVGRVRFGDLRRTQPICREYGSARGRPVDRYYIENFLAEHGRLITGSVLEIGERTYTERFGQGVTRSDMLHVSDGADATYVADLTDAPQVPSNTYDCIILTQTLQMIFDLRATVRTLYRLLAPGGVLLCTAPGISQVADPVWNSTWYWSFTRLSMQRLFDTAFPPGNVDARAHGNVLSATAFLQGLAQDELRCSELDVVDPEYPVILTVAARKGDLDQRHRPAIDAPAGSVLDLTDPRYGSIAEFLGTTGGASPVADWGALTVHELEDRTIPAYSIVLPHVLEHTWAWRRILRNAVARTGGRLTVMLSVPLGDSELRLDNEQLVPTLQLPREEFLAHFDGMTVRTETVETDTGGSETWFHVEK
ncbi:methyltransferase domain-containing protein [Gordonia sp. i37]|uniref:methyltransferase domain-containing protein n=1 Tax=Gordonia sp. i37 TaxID=1961707 RepID=UPI001555CEA3|nr:methyltransferase domain-containing protein [Gordonia sp. i37]